MVIRPLTFGFHFLWTVLLSSLPSCHCVTPIHVAPEVSVKEHGSSRQAARCVLAASPTGCSPFQGDLSPSTSNTEVTYGGEPAGQAVHLGSSSPFPSLPCASVSSLTPFFFAFHSIFFLLAFLQVSLASASHLLSPPAALLSHFLSLTTASVNLHNLPPSTVAWTGWG